MSHYKQCIVAFLDILGFKQIIGEKEFDDILRIFQTIVTKTEANIALYHAVDNCSDLEGESVEPCSDNKSMIQYNESLNNTNIHVMSDSIVVSTPDIYPESLAVIVDTCNIIQEQLLNLENPILLRGAIAVGDYFQDGNILFGKGLVTAYLAQERYAVYPRIILSKEVMTGRKPTIDSNNDLPKDADGYYRIDSIERYLDIENVNSWSEVEESDGYKKLLRMIDKNLNGYSDDKVRQKYIWLEDLLMRIEGKVIRKTELGSILLPVRL